MVPVRNSLAALCLGFGLLVACSADTLAVDIPNPGGKQAGTACAESSECQSLSCKSGKCTAVTGGNPTDGKQNGDETDVDCGGDSAPACADGKACEVATDCSSGACTSEVCRAPAPDDGVKNGDETDVDCGGTKAPKCATARACATNADCASDACSYAKACVAFKSCTGHFGGDTCGAGETGETGATHESCCTTVPSSGNVAIGKYLVTAGRMRAFAIRFGGNIKQWATSTNPPGLDAGLMNQLPSNMAEVDGTFGPGNKRGCRITGTGGGSRTWSQAAVDGDDAEKSDFSQDVLDEKALNCFPWYMAQALCAFDGGRLPTNAEVNALVTNGGKSTWPWQPNDTKAYSAATQDPRVNHRRNYATPNPPANLRRVQVGGTSEPRDRSFFVSPPGRFPGSANAIGVQDAVGDLLVWVGDQHNRFNYTISWEDHGRESTAKSWPPSDTDGDEEDGYYAIGARCVFER